MYTEDSNTGFFGGLKNLFSNKKTTPSEGSNSTGADTDLMVEEYIAVKTEDAEAPTDKPMGTRTVDYSQAETAPSPKANEYSGQSIDQAVYSGTNEPGDIQTEQELDILFAGNLIEKGGKFIYCETIAEAVRELKEIVREMNWAHVFYWENEIKDAFCENNFQKGAIGFTMENSDAAMCLCETLVADTGSLILNPKQASRRRLLVFPKVQIFLADTSQIAADLNKAVDLFNIKNRGELPSVLDLSDNVKGHYYHDGNLVLKAEGSPDIYVFLVDEKITPSLRS